MLQHLSPKFEMPPSHREPRAALILNRFTRSLSVMFCTNAIASILGLPAEVVQNKSFYECIQESCLEDAVKCLESAKANDSIAYMRFWSRDPRREEDLEDEETDDEEDAAIDGVQEDGVDGHAIKEESEDEGISDGIRPHHQRSHDSQISDSDSGGVRLDDEMDLDSDGQSGPRVKMEEDTDGVADVPRNPQELRDGETAAESSTSASAAHNRAPAVNGNGVRRNRSPTTRAGRRQPRYPLPAVELEAVVSCTSDGLVVILRKARPPIPSSMQPPTVSVTPQQGIFAAPWGQHTIRPQYPVQAPAQPQAFPVHQAPSVAQTASAHSSGPSLDHLMDSIREIAVFAWALVGINGNLASYSRGRPMAGAQPVGGLPVWDPNAGQTSYLGPENQAVARWAAYENGTLHWPSRGLGGGGPSTHPGGLGATEMKGPNGHTSNGYNGNHSNGHSNHTPNGYGSYLPNGHSNTPNGSGSSSGHSNGDANGHNYSLNGQSNYTLGASLWHAQTQQSNGSSSDGYGQQHASNRNHDALSNGHAWTDSPAEAAWNLAFNTHQDGTNNGTWSTHNNGNQHPRR